MAGTFDSESTIIRPGGGSGATAPVLRLNAGGAPKARSPFAERPPAKTLGKRAAPPRAASVDGWDPRSLGGHGVPPLVAAALPLLNLAGRLRGLSEQPNLDALRAKVIGAATLFEQEGLGSGATPERVRAAHYALCVAIDDIVLNAPWGSFSVWARQGLVSTLHTDVTGGERFFDLLAHLHKDPGSNRDVLLIMYYCLSIGFEGRMRVHPQGHLEIGRIREGLYRTLRGDVERELSPHWRGVDARHRPLSTPLVLWTTLAAAVLALVALYLTLGAWLDHRSDGTLTALLQAPPHGAPSLLRPAGRDEPADGRDGRTDALRRALAPEISKGICTVDDADGGARISLRNEGLFAVGKADINPDFAMLLDKIGRLLRAQEAVQVAVIGYTDTTPIHTDRFPSNYYLSVGRAEAASRLLAQYVDPLKIRSEGRGAADPVATNATAEGREKNRRTEIIVYDRKDVR